MTTTIVLSNRQGLYLPRMLHTLGMVGGAGDPIIVDDSGSKSWRGFVARSLPVVPVADEAAGYTAAMRRVWDVARDLGDMILFVEEDWEFLEPISIGNVERQLVLGDHAQVRLARGPVFQREHRRGVAATWWPSQWTCNPSLIAPTTFDHDWPDVQWSEQAFGEQLVMSDATFGVFGDERNPIVRHIGDQRAATSGGY